MTRNRLFSAKSTSRDCDHLLFRRVLQNQRVRDDLLARR